MYVHDVEIDISNHVLICNMYLFLNITLVGHVEMNVLQISLGS